MSNHRRVGSSPISRTKRRKTPESVGFRGFSLYINALLRFQNALWGEKRRGFAIVFGIMRMHFANKRLTICAWMNLLIQMLASLAALLQMALRVIAVVGRYNLLVASLKSLAFVAVIACIYPHLAGNRTSDGQLSLPIHPFPFYSCFQYFGNPHCRNTFKSRFPRLISYTVVLLRLAFLSSY